MPNKKATGDLIDLPWDEPIPTNTNCLIRTDNLTKLDQIQPITRGLFGLLVEGVITVRQFQYAALCESDHHEPHPEDFLTEAEHDQLRELGLDPRPITGIASAHEWDWDLIEAKGGRRA